MAQSISPQAGSLRAKLTDRISKDGVCELCRMIKGEGNDELMAELYGLTQEPDMRVSVNALWVFTHLDEAGDVWLYDKQNELIDRVLKENNVTRCRLLLSLLHSHPFSAESLRADFLDYCLSKITAVSQPYAVRALCMKLAYEQCRHYPELLAELQMVLDLLQTERLSPGLASALRQVVRKMGKRKERE